MARHGGFKWPKIVREASEMEDYQGYQVARRGHGGLLPEAHWRNVC